jgi:tryptophanyl-tRNA synthetase
VIPTIKKVVDEFISKNNPNLFIFLKTDTSESRERIYNEFSDEMSKKYDYKRSVKTIDNVVVYFLAHDLTEKDYLDTIYFITLKYGSQ